MAIKKKFDKKEKSILKLDRLFKCIGKNAEIIAQEKFGGWNSKKSFIETTKKCNECIKNKKSLIFETIFSTIEKVEFVKKAIDAGFFVRLFFIATESPAINAKRVTLRLLKGVHNVPIDKIISRHSKSIVNFSKIINLVDRAYIYDNSVAPSTK